MSTNYAGLTMEGIGSNQVLQKRLFLLIELCLGSLPDVPLFSLSDRQNNSPVLKVQLKEDDGYGSVMPG